MNKPQIIGIGINGLVGSRVVELLSNDFDFKNFDRKSGVDISNKDSLSKLKNVKNSRFILLMASKTDVDGCERDKDLGENGEAWKINVEGVANVVDFAKENDKKIIFMSTDFVFDGEKSEKQEYREEDIENPINWYGKTKFEGEQRIRQGQIDYMIVRIAYPFRAKFEEKLDFVRFIKNRLESGTEISMVVDHIFSPVYIDDVAYGLKTLINDDATGLFHLVGEEKITPYGAAVRIADVFGLDRNLIRMTTRAEFFKDRAARPFNLALSNDKIEKLGVKINGFDQSLQLIKSEIQ